MHECITCPSDVKPQCIIVFRYDNSLEVSGVIRGTLHCTNYISS